MALYTYYCSVCDLHHERIASMDERDEQYCDTPLCKEMDPQKKMTRAGVEESPATFNVNPFKFAAITTDGKKVKGHFEKG